MLATKYRPNSFSDLVGQKLTAVVLQRMVDTDRVPTGLLFSGPSGTGKTSTARILARCLDPDYDPVELDAASNGGVAEIRSLIESLQYGFPGKYRIVILDEAQSLTREAFNALLKTLEEPPAGTVFVLASTEPEKIPETVKSRLIEFEFRRVAPNDIYSRLVHIVKVEGIEIQSAVLARMSLDSNGSVRHAIMLLDQCSLAGIENLPDYLEMVGDADVAPSLIRAFMSGDHKHIFEVLDAEYRRIGNPRVIVAQILRCLRDLLVLRAGGTVEVGADERRDLAFRLEKERIEAAVQILWDVRTRLPQSDDPRGNLDLVAILISRVFSAGQQAPTTKPAEPTAEKRLSIDDMRRRA